MLLHCPHLTCELDLPPTSFLAPCAFSYLLPWGIILSICLLFVVCLPHWNIISINIQDHIRPFPHDTFVVSPVLGLSPSSGLINVLKSISSEELPLTLRGICLFSCVSLQRSSSSPLNASSPKRRWEMLNCGLVESAIKLGIIVQATVGKALVLTV